MATNLWAMFKRLLPNTPLTIVTINSVNNDGTSTVTSAGGGAMRVRGTTVAAGKKAYVKDGSVVGEAPNLQHFEIEV